MRVFLAGATGAIGQRLVPQLVAAGHDVVGTTRTPARAEALRRAGAEPVVLDGLDAPAVMDAVMLAQPDVVVHQMTALANMGSLRHFDREFRATNALRTHGTDNLLAAARAAGAHRFVAQSYSGWPNARTGAPVKTEDDPLDASPPASMSETLGAIRHLETAVTGADGIEGVVLRCGTFYGPGSPMDNETVKLVRKRRFPLVGAGTGVWSFVHVEDAAAATLLAIEGGEPGIYNIVDDDPAPVAEWLPYLARCLGAGPPRRVPVWVGRLAGGEAVVSLMTAIRGSSNAKARRELGWTPAHPTWRDGFGLTPEPAAPPAGMLQAR